MTEVKRRFGRRKHRWEGNIEVDLKEVRCDYVDWISVAQYRVQRPYVMSTDRSWGPVKVLGFLIS
jgi:hypothetical protein